MCFFSNLNFNVSRIVDKLLNEKTIVAEARGRLGL